MRDCHRTIGVGHRTDAIKTFSIAGGDPFVLAHVFLPRRDNELLDETVGLGTVAPHTPRTCARSPAAKARIVKRLQEAVLDPNPGPVLNADHHRSTWCLLTGQLRHRPVAGGQ